jgi:hypothetical protein
MPTAISPVGLNQNHKVTMEVVEDWVEKEDVEMED